MTTDGGVELAWMIERALGWRDGHRDKELDDLLEAAMTVLNKLDIGDDALVPVQATGVELERFRPAVEALRKNKRAMLLTIDHGQLAEHYRPLYEAEITECDALLSIINSSALAAVEQQS